MHLLYPPQSSKDTGLGNTLFQISTLYSLSKENNLIMNLYELVKYCKLLNTFGFDHDKKIFKYLLDNYDCSNYDDKYMIIKEGEKYQVEQYLDTHFIQRIQNNHLNNNIKIEGYFQSHLYFDKYRNDILNIFKIDNESLTYIKDKYPILFDENIICISIHIRMNYANCINYNLNYFNETIEFFKQKFNNIHFMIFSNNIDSIKNWFNDNNIYTYVNSNIDYIDLWIMSLCKHNIITHSTFSWWGAYLNNYPNKIVTYPTDTLKISMGTLFTNYKFEQRLFEYYMKDWIKFDIKTLVLYK